MEALGSASWERPCGRRRSGFGTPNAEHLLLTVRITAGDYELAVRSMTRFLALLHCTVMLTVAVLLARLGSGVSPSSLRSP